MERPAKKLRKVRAGPFKVPLVEPSGTGSRGDLVRRARKHYRGVAQGPRPAVDVDESVRQGPRRPAPGPAEAGHRPPGPFLSRHDDGDDDAD